MAVVKDLILHFHFASFRVPAIDCDKWKFWIEKSRNTTLKLAHESQEYDGISHCLASSHSESEITFVEDIHDEHAPFP